VIALDSNILVYAHREEAPFHEIAARRLADLAQSQVAWAIPWPCLHEFLNIITHPRIYNPPTPLNVAIETVEAWLKAPTLILLAEADDYWPHLRAAISAGKIIGPRVHDARIAALCRQHGVRELWSADRDFSRFPELNVVNPLAG
jgi:uncharacterized protein